MLHKVWKLLFNKKKIKTLERKLKYTETSNFEQIKAKSRTFYREQICGSFRIALISRAWSLVFDLFNGTIYLLYNNKFTGDIFKRTFMYTL